MVTKRFLLAGILLLGMTAVSSWEVKMNSIELKMHMYETVQVPFFTDVPATSNSKVQISANNSDPNVIDVDLPIFNNYKIAKGFWNDTINVTGLFLGKAKIILSISLDEVRTDNLILSGHLV